MRVSTAFNRLLQIPGAWVTDVVIGERDVEVTLRPRARLLRCPCGMLCSAVYDRRRRRWRHLDLARCRLWLVYEIRRLDCPDCGIRTEELPWARPGARHTRDFEDMVLWLAQRTDRTSVATLMRCGWETVTAIINRGVAELLDARRLDTLYRIGVDEICYRHPHRYLTIIGDHDTGTVVDIQPGRSDQSLANFYASQPDSDLAQIEAVSMDVSSAYTEATRTHVPHAVICYDPFHIMRWANRALDAVYSEAATGPGRASMSPAQMAHHPLGAAHRRKQTHRRQTRPGQPDRPHQPPHRPRLDPQRTTARHLPPQPPTRRGPPTSAPLDHRRQTQPHQRLRRPGQTARGLLRRGHRRHRTGHLQRPHRRHQRQNPTHQRPRLRTPLRPNTEPQ